MNTNKEAGFDKALNANVGFDKALNANVSVAHDVQQANGGDRP